MSKFTEKMMGFLKLNDDYDEYDEYDDEYETELLPLRKEKSNITEIESYNREESSGKKTSKAFGKTSNKIVPMRSSKPGLEVCVIKSTGMEDVSEIVQTLLSGKAVVLNLEGIHFETAQRIIDYTAGACYAMDGRLKSISKFIFIATPKAVDVSGDLPDLLDGGLL